MLVDHVVYAVKDAAATATALRRTHGLGAVEGVFHPGQGTHNWVVPLRWPQYLEIVEIVDAEAAFRSPIGRQIAARVARRDGLLGWAAQPTDIDAVAARVGVAPSNLLIRDPDGRTTTARIVYGGIQLPFFVDYGADPAQRRELFEKRRVAARHEVEPSHFAWIEQGGDEVEVRAWLHEETLPVRFAKGAPGPKSVAIATNHGEVVLP